MAISPMTSTSSVLSVRLTRTLSMTTWKNSGEMRRKKLKKKRGREYLAQQMTVLVDGAKKPADVEMAGQFHQVPRDLPSEPGDRPKSPQTPHATSASVATDRGFGR